MESSVLIVDDDPAILRMLKKYLAGDGYEVLSAGNGAEALRIILSEGPSIVITDWMMPEMDGLQLCRAIRSSEAIGLVYIIVLTAHTDKNRLVEAFETGADDFLSKPFSREELRARLNAGIRIIKMQEDLTHHNWALHKANAELAVLNRKLECMATTDALTGLVNRRDAMARLDGHWAMSVRCNEPLACMLLDIDHFKSFNDTYGHDVGDAVLRETARVLTSYTRGGETACRLGGEEFLILCPNATASRAAAGAERLRRAIESNRVGCNDLGLSVTVSVGVAERDETINTPGDLLKRVDDALYTAKRAGRNQVRIPGERPTVPPPHSSRGTLKADDMHPTQAEESGESPITVLVVDDDGGARALCRKFLELAGHEVREAVDGLDALAKIRPEMTDVVIMDVMMPNMDGLECTRRLKADPATRNIPVIMATALTQQEDIVAGLEAGVDEYVTKPIRQREFVLRTRSMARLHRGKLELLRANEARGEHAQALTLLLDLSWNLLAAQDLDAVLEKTVSVTAEVTRSRRVSIMLPDAKDGSLTIAKAIGVDEQIAATARVPTGGAIAGRVFQSGEPVVVNTPEEVRHQFPQYDSEFFASVPLVSKALSSSEGVMGVLNITERQDKRPFEASELEYVDLICNMAASTIDDIAARRARDEAQDSIVVALARLTEHRDNDTGKHLDRVTRFSLILAEELSTTDRFHKLIDTRFLRDLKRAAPLHDIGKVAIADHLLLKPGKLTPEETAQMRRHAEIGAATIHSTIERVAGVGFLRIAEEIAWGHHEWYDGSGYPRGLKGHGIPLSARIVALADVYDALTTKRVYKDAIPHQEAVGVIQEGSGSQFDPAVVDAFVKREDEFASVAADLADAPQMGEQAEMVMALDPFCQETQSPVAEPPNVKKESTRLTAEIQI